MTPFSNKDVEARYAAFPQPIKNCLLALRQMIFDQAKSSTTVGELTETLRWGEPSYLTEKSRSGSMIRLNVLAADRKKKEPQKYGLYFHCQTSLVDTFRQIYEDELEFDGNRAIVLDSNKPVPKNAIIDCIDMALNYHLRKT